MRGSFRDGLPLHAGRIRPQEGHQEGIPLASRSNTRFQKRLKELARAAKRREKAEKKALRKAQKMTGGGGPPIEPIDPVDLGLPPLEEEEEPTAI